jgi:hypothetical protein
MKPMLLIVTAIVAFGSIVARADAIDTEHLFGFTIGKSNTLAAGGRFRIRKATPIKLGGIRGRGASQLRAPLVPWAITLP